MHSTARQPASIRRGMGIIINRTISLQWTQMSSFCFSCRSSLCRFDMRYNNDDASRIKSVSFNCIRLPSSSRESRQEEGQAERNRSTNSYWKLYWLSLGSKLSSLYSGFSFFAVLSEWLTNWLTVLPINSSEIDPPFFSWFTMSLLLSRYPTLSSFLWLHFILSVSPHNHGSVSIQVELFIQPDQIGLTRVLLGINNYCSRSSPSTDADKWVVVDLW